MSVEYRFTRQILIGAQAFGFDLPSMAKAMKVKNADMFAFSAGTRRMSEKQASALERMSGLTLGELALRGIQAQANPEKFAQQAELFRSTYAMFAEQREPGEKPARSARRRQTA